MVGILAVRWMALLMLASRLSSPAWGSQEDSAETAVRRASIGSGQQGKEVSMSLTLSSNSRSATSRALNSSNRVWVGSSPNQSR